MSVATAVPPPRVIRCSTISVIAKRIVAIPIPQLPRKGQDIFHTHMDQNTKCLLQHRALCSRRNLIADISRPSSALVTSWALAESQPEPRARDNATANKSVPNRTRLPWFVYDLPELIRHTYIRTNVFYLGSHHISCHAFGAHVMYPTDLHSR